MCKMQAIVLNNIGGGFDILVHRLPAPHETVMMTGMQLSQDLAKGGNVAVALARLGVRTAIIGKLGMDEAGDRDAAWLDEAGVDTTGLLRDASVMTGQGIGLIADNGDNIMITGESSSRALTQEEVCAAMDRLSPAGFFVGGFEVRPSLVMPAMRRAKALGMTTVLNPSPVPEEGVEAPLACIDYLFVNEVEARLLAGMAADAPAEAEALCRTLQARYGCGAVVLTLGGDGAACLSAAGFFRFSPVPVQAVDTAGAGDGFLAAVVAGLLQGKPLADACAWANWFGAYSVTRRECLPGYADAATIDAFIAAHGAKG